jgi:hypothetical protein
VVNVPPGIEAIPAGEEVSGWTGLLLLPQLRITDTIAAAKKKVHFIEALHRRLLENGAINLIKVPFIESRCSRLMAP